MSESKFPTDKTDKAIDAGAVIVSMVPWIGGPVGAVLSGIGQQRKLNRVQEVLDKLAEDIKDVESDVAKKYVKTEDFEELLEQTLRRAADERQEDVRELYVHFLRRAITQPGDEYDEQMQVLESIERIRNSHVQVLRAIAQAPGPDTFHKTLGSVVGTLTERTRLPRDELAEVLEDLTSLRLINKPNTHAMMSGVGAEDLRHLIRPLGGRVLDYVGPT